MATEFRGKLDSMEAPLVVEASQASSIVVGDEGVEVGVTFGVVAETSVAGGAVLRHAVEMLAEAVIEALNHAVIRYVIIGAFSTRCSL